MGALSVQAVAHMQVQMYEAAWSIAKAAQSIYQEEKNSEGVAEVQDILFRIGQFYTPAEENAKDKEEKEAELSTDIVPMPTAPREKVDRGSLGATGIEQMLIEEITEIVDDEVFTMETSLMSMGVTSTQVMSLKYVLEETIGFDLSPTITFDFPSVRALADHVASKMGAHET